MPLSPAPLLPGTSPIPTPGGRPPDRRALRLGALAAIPILVVALVVGQFALPYILFLAPGLQAQSGGGDAGTGAGDFQGFIFAWSRGQPGGGGYTTPASLQNLQSERHDFHMNAVIIPVVADMPQRSASDIYWHASDKQDLDTLPDSDYVRAIQDAHTAGLTPILELQTRQLDSGPSQDPTYIGETWSSLHSTSSIGLGQIGDLERNWFNNYTAFAVHYAQMSAQYNLPFFIIGDQLTNVTYDTRETTKANDPQGIDIPPGDSYQCSGRRDCEWRHVLQAIHSPGYATLGDHKSQVGGSYKGKLIYAARWTGAHEGGATDPEFEKITWWDAVDYIGVDAYFPLTDVSADVDVNLLEQAWQGVGQGLGLPPAQQNIYSRLEKVSDTYHHPIVFTAAGYNSSPGSNSAHPGAAAFDDVEQLNDMQALLYSFRGTSWWAGVFWSADAPITPRESQPNWQYSSLWAGNTLSSSKKAGQWLATYYQPSALPGGS